MKKSLLIILCSLGIAYANQVLLWMPSVQLKGFASAITAVGKQQKVPVTFPSFVPMTPEVTYYLNFDPVDAGDNTYHLYVDSTADCAGAHYCNILSFTVSTKGRLKTYNVTLTNGVQANYTPGVAKADYWNPNLVWQQKGITYTLSWHGLPDDPDQTQNALIAMANHLQAYPVQSHS